MLDFGSEFWLIFVEFTAIYALMVVSPGPDFALVVRNSLMYSRSTGLYTALGTSLGLIWHATYTFVGLAFIVHESKWGLNIIRLLGGSYLLYLGISSIIKKSTVLQDMEKKISSEHHKKKDLTPFQAIRVGFLTDALNPFCLVFFVAVFLDILGVDLDLHVKLFFGTEIFLIALVWFLGVALFFSHKHVRQQFARLGLWFGRIMGLILIMFGVKTLSSLWF